MQDTKRSIRIFVAALTLIMALAQVAAAVENCMNNGPRMTDIKANLIWCLNGYGGSYARALIIYGRYNGQNAPMVKKGYGECQKGQQAFQNFGFCDEASFWVAANDILPAADYEKYPEAKRNPENGAVTMSPYQPHGMRCQALDGRMCVLPGPAPLASSCSCGDALGNVVR